MPGNFVAFYGVPALLQYKSVPVTAYQQNCSLLWCDQTRQAALVDPGGEVDRLLALSSSLGLDLVKILLTHGHLDHVGGTAELKKRLQLPVEGPQRDDAFWIQGLQQQAALMGLPSVESFEPDRWLEDGDTVSVGNETLQVRHCPGHTPGHVIFYHPGSRKAFVGDVLFKGSIGRTDFPRGDYRQLVDSIRNKLWPLGDDVSFVPGHGPESSFGRERQSNPFVADSRFG